MSVTTAIVLDKRREYKKTNEYPVCIRITYRRDNRRYWLGFSLSERDFQKLSSPNLGEKLRKIRENTEKEEQRAKTIIRNLRKFSFEAFGDEFLVFMPGRRRKRSTKSTFQTFDNGQTLGANDPLPNQDRSDEIRRVNFKNQFGGRKYPVNMSEIDFASLGEVASHYGVYIRKLEALDKISTVSCYMSSLTSLLDFRDRPRFIDITELELYKYEKWMESKGKSITTISMYIRCLRHIFKVAIAKKQIDPDLYPFGSEKYVIPNGQNVKKAVSIEDIQRIYEYRSPDQTKMMYRDFWMLIYAMGSMSKTSHCSNIGMLMGNLLDFQGLKRHIPRGLIHKLFLFFVRKRSGC